MGHFFVAYNNEKQYKGKYEYYIVKRNVPISYITDFLNALGIMLGKYAL
jgi:hypothetical protein